MKRYLTLLKIIMRNTLNLMVALCLGFTGCVFAGGERAVKPAGEAEYTPLLDAVAHLQQVLAPLISFSARFKQSVYAPDGYPLQYSSGELKVMRPGKIYWASEAPMEQLVIADGETLWIYDPDLEQVTIRPFQKDIANTPAVLFIGALDNLADYYQVTSETLQDTQQFTLIPVDRNSLYSKMGMGFSGTTPVSMDLWDSLGQRTAILFENPQLNPQIDQALFDFVPPQGVDILVNEER